MGFGKKSSSTPPKPEPTFTPVAPTKAKQTERGGRYEAHVDRALMDNPSQNLMEVDEEKKKKTAVTLS